jgi:hypothetical protein
MVLAKLDRLKSPRNRNCHITTDRGYVRWDPAYPAIFYHQLQTSEFPYRISLSRGYIRDAGALKIRKKEFHREPWEAAISKPPPITYMLTRCHCANFLERSGRVTHRGFIREFLWLRKIRPVEKIRMRTITTFMQQTSDIFTTTPHDSLIPAKAHNISWTKPDSTRVRNQSRQDAQSRAQHNLQRAARPDRAKVFGRKLSRPDDRAGHCNVTGRRSWQSDA